MNALVRSHAPSGVRLLAVYIAEAHARDQWPVGKTISCVDQPTLLADRLRHAEEFRKNFKLEMPMLVDNMENTFHTTYGAWPFRFYIIDQGRLVLKAEPNETTFAYDMDTIDQWFNEFHRSRRHLNL